MLYLSIGCSLLAGWLWNKGLSSTAANRSGIFLALKPVFGVLLAFVLIGERLSIMGVLLAILASAASFLLPSKR